MNTLSIIIPAKDEAEGLNTLLPSLKLHYPNAEIIVVNDGSTDDTEKVCDHFKVTLVNHPYSMGNGAAVKSGARAATGQILVFMDGDGQHEPEDIVKLLERIDAGFDMAIGARNKSSQASIGRMCANTIYNYLASWMVNQKIEDLTSGFRAIRAGKFKNFLYLLPNGFSYPTTITMAFFRAGYTISYVPIVTNKRQGKSHIHPLKDSIRFFLIIFRVGTLYSPLKIFFPVSLTLFFLGCGYYGYTYITQGRFTNMSALLITSAIIIFLIGLVSEQITSLVYSQKND